MKPVVLLVDDDSLLLEAMCRALRKEPYEIICAGSAVEALGMLAERSVDVVVSDEEMPGMKGTVFLRHVRTRYPDTVRFILTGKATVPTAIEAINNGGITRFFIKPCNSTEVAVSIGQGLQQRELLLAARKLLQKGRQQTMLIEKLEKSYPDISKVERDGDGAIQVENWNGDIQQLMQEICAHLDDEKEFQPALVNGSGNRP